MCSMKKTMFCYLEIDISEVAKQNAYKKAQLRCVSTFLTSMGKEQRDKTLLD